jgi:hypothetical protein
MYNLADARAYFLAIDMISLVTPTLRQLPIHGHKYSNQVSEWHRATLERQYTIAKGNIRGVCPMPPLFNP